MNLTKRFMLLCAMVTLSSASAQSVHTNRFLRASTHDMPTTTANGIVSDNVYEDDLGCDDEDSISPEINPSSATDGDCDKDKDGAISPEITPSSAADGDCDKDKDGAISPEINPSNVENYDDDQASGLANPVYGPVYPGNSQWTGEEQLISSPSSISENTYVPIEPVSPSLSGGNPTDNANAATQTVNPNTAVSAVHERC